MAWMAVQTLIAAAFSVSLLVGSLFGTGHVDVGGLMRNLPLDVVRQSFLAKGNASVTDQWTMSAIEATDHDPMSFMTDVELEAEGNACLSAVNGYRQMKGLPALGANDGKNECTAGQAANDKVQGWHKAFGRCGESAQCEASGPSDCASAIKMYFDEGPGGGHYNIIMSTKYKTMSWGRSDNFWAHDFF